MAKDASCQSVDQAANSIDELTDLIQAKVQGLQLGLVTHAARDELLDPVARHVQLLEHQLVPQQIGREVLDLIVAQIDDGQPLGVIEQRLGQETDLVLIQIQQIQIAQLPESPWIDVLQLVVLNATARGDKQRVQCAQVNRNGVRLQL